MATLTKQTTIPTDAVVERASRPAGVRLFRVKSRTTGITYEATAITFRTWQDGECVERVCYTCTCRARNNCWHKEAVRQFCADLAAKEEAYRFELACHTFLY